MSGNGQETMGKVEGPNVTDGKQNMQGLETASEERLVTMCVQTHLGETST